MAGNGNRSINELVEILKASDVSEVERERALMELQGQLDFLVASRLDAVFYQAAMEASDPAETARLQEIASRIRIVNPLTRGC